MKQKYNSKAGLVFFLIILAFVVVEPSWPEVFGTFELVPEEAFESVGQTGGPFEPVSKTYELTNIGAEAAVWGVDGNVDWIDFDVEWGILDPNEFVIVTVALTSAAEELPGGVHTDTLTFTDITHDTETTRDVILTITAPAGVLEVTPTEDFETGGEPGGPFMPYSKEYQLKNTGGQYLYWGISKTANWIEIDDTFGELDPNEAVTITVTLTSEAEQLGEGVYTDTLVFTNLTDMQEQTREVILTVEHIEGIWINPASFDVEVIEGMTLDELLTIGNDSEEILNFTIRTRVVQQDLNGSNSWSSNREFDVIGPDEYKADELIVRFRPDPAGHERSITDRNQILSNYGCTVVRDFRIVDGLSLVCLNGAMTVEEAVGALNDVDEILYAEPNYRIHVDETIPNDTRFDELWGMHNTGQTGGVVDADIDAPQAWDIAAGNSQVIVAIIDTGVDYNHVDLAANMWVNEAEANGTGGVDDDGNGYIDDIYGYDFCNNDANPMDDHYHGTHCAGTVGAVGNNGQGVAGVCWDVRIMAIKFLDSGGGGWTDDAIDCVEYATLMGANVMSNSWGGGSYNEGLKEAIDEAGQAGILFVASAGNDSANNDTYPHYPSSYSSANVIAVLSTDKYDEISDFSNYGPASVDLGAPGSSILSCEPSNQYGYHNGTSMAAPHVAGACALLWSVNPMLPRTEVKEILLSTVDELDDLSNRCVSDGRLNIYNAILETGVPWLEVAIEEGTLNPDESLDIGLTFNATELQPGVYLAEIVITSNDPYRPTLIIPVSMTVKQDDLVITPAEGFDSGGDKGGPFGPESKEYTLTNIGLSSIDWTLNWDQDWLETDSFEGTLEPEESVSVVISISEAALLLEPGLYTDQLTFLNETSGSIKRRQVNLEVRPPDMFTESFDEDTGLQNCSITLRPDGSSAYYSACLDAEPNNPMGGFFTDPGGGISVSIGDDDFAEVILTGGKKVPLYGIAYGKFYIGSNGYITFGSGDPEYFGTLESHFTLPRISALFTDLTPPDADCVSYKQLEDRIAVTFADVPLFGDKDAKNSFQIEMFFVDETIRITWLQTNTDNAVVGLSEGMGIPGLFIESDLSEYIECCFCGDFDGSGSVDLGDLLLLAGRWMETECAGPGWCDRTDIDRSGTVALGDFTSLAENYKKQEYDWSPPALLTEFNVPAGDVAESPCLSRDGLTMYFRRHIPEIGFKRIFEATRANIEGTFIAERMLTELSTTGRNLGPAWISDDNLRLYYSEVHDKHIIKMAQRTNVGDTWTPVKTFTELHPDDAPGSCMSLTSDELIIFFHSTREGSIPGAYCNLWTARRGSIEEPFTDLRPLDEINSSQTEFHPFVLPDGLTLYFSSNREGDYYTNIYKASRSSLDEPFGQIVQIPVSTPDGLEEQPYVTADEKTLYYRYNDLGWINGIVVSNFEPVLMEQWSEPVALSELNDGDNVAINPSLSQDGLTIYFHRMVPAFGHMCIIEATRQTPDGEFTSERVLTELRTSGETVWNPWVTDDNLRLYYCEAVDGSQVIKMAERAQVGDAWTLVEAFPELGNSMCPSLTPDELIIFFTSRQPGSAYGEDAHLWTATRPSIDEPFGEVRPLDEINGSERDSSPHILPDGLTLYFNTTRRDPQISDILKASRSSTNEPFSNLEWVSISTYNFGEYGTYITPDEKTIYFVRCTATEKYGIFVSSLEKIIEQCLPR
jgi:subtilisin family serine protease/Tol biopolymer transport system component